MSKDHYVPRFILKRFQKSRFGKVYYTSKEADRIRLKPVKDIFKEDDGERILATPPNLREDRGFATLDGEPQWTEVAAEKLQLLEDSWARAIRGLIEWDDKHNDTARRAYERVVNVQRGPINQNKWVAQAADYCMRTLIRSKESGNELWNRYAQSEERDLEVFIERQLEKKLRPSAELRRIFQQDNRARTRTGALADGTHLFRRHNLQVTVGIWRTTDNTRFIIGSRGGCLVEHESLKVFLFPIAPRVALSLQSRDSVNSVVGLPYVTGDERIVTVHRIPGVSGITAKKVNEAMWSACDAVAGLERRDIEAAIAT